MSQEGEEIDLGYVPEPDLDARAQPFHFTDDLPSTFTVSPAYTPPPGAQGAAGHMGTPGSCAAWSLLYGVATFMGAKKGDFDPSTGANQASPAYLYIRERIAQKKHRGPTPPCKGSGFGFYLTALTTTGTPNCNVAPYEPSCAFLVANYGDLSREFAMDPRFNIHSSKVVSTKDLDSIKQVLASDHPLAYATSLWPGFFRYTGGVYVLPPNTQGLGAHCMMLIGYDDGKQAVCVQNSLGPDWGEQGLAWIDYASFQTLAKGSAVHLID